MDFSSILTQRQGALQSLFGTSMKQSAAQVTPTVKKKTKAPELPAMQLPSWMTDISSILNAMNTPSVDLTMPSIPVPDPLSTLSVSSGQEQRLRRKRSGILSAIGSSGDSGGWTA